MSQDGSSSCRCLTTSHGDLKKMNGNANLTPSSFLCMRKDFHQENGDSSDLDQKRSGILLMIAIHKENGTESQNWWWYFFRKRTPSFPCHESIVPRNAQKQRWWKIINTLFCADEGTIETVLFVAQLFLVISSVSTEQSQICVMNTVPVKQERRDPYLQDNMTHCSRQQTYW